MPINKPYKVPGPNKDRGKIPNGVSRGESLRGTPLASDIEKSVAKRIKRMK